MNSPKDTARPAIPRQALEQLVATKGDRRIGITRLLLEAIEFYVAHHGTADSTVWPPSLRTK